jgi:hypothetical protein
MATVFPSVTGRDLHKETKTVPDDFTGKNLVVITAFQQWHQPLVNQSMAALQAACVDQSHHVLEMPVIRTSSKFRQMRLDSIMRAAFKDPIIRSRTITVYLDKEMFRRSLEIPNEDTVHWFVVDHETKAILERGEGPITADDVSRCFAD